MPTASVIFRKCILNTPEAQGDPHHVGSRVFFDVEIDGKGLGLLFADITHPVGPQAEAGPLGVTPVQGYDRLFGSPMFQWGLEFYYRQVVGASGLIGGMIGVAKLMQGYVLEPEMRIQFEVEEQANEEPHA
jgi:hypothetical protein